MRGSSPDRRRAGPSLTRGLLARTWASTGRDVSSRMAAATPSDLVRMGMCTGDRGAPDSRGRQQPALDPRASLDGSPEKGFPLAANQVDLVDLRALERTAVGEHEDERLPVDTGRLARRRLAGSHHS